MGCSIINTNIVKGPWPTSLDKCLIFTAFLSQAMVSAMGVICKEKVRGTLWL